jgi:hypothetical protein
MSSGLLRRASTYAFWSPNRESPHGGRFRLMRDAIQSAGIADLTCSPHGLGKTPSRLRPNAGASVHDIHVRLVTLAKRALHTGSQRNDTATGAPLP